MPGVILQQSNLKYGQECFDQIAGPVFQGILCQTSWTQDQAGSLPVVAAGRFGCFLGAGPSLGEGDGCRLVAEQDCRWVRGQILGNYFGQSVRAGSETGGRSAWESEWVF